MRSYDVCKAKDSACSTFYVFISLDISAHEQGDDEAEYIICAYVSVLGYVCVCMRAYIFN